MVLTCVCAVAARPGRHQTRPQPLAAEPQPWICSLRDPARARTRLSRLPAWPGRIGSAPPAVTHRIVQIHPGSICATLLLVADRQRCDHLDPASLARPLIENKSRVAAIICLTRNGTCTGRAHAASRAAWFLPSIDPRPQEQRVITALLPSASGYPSQRSVACYEPRPWRPVARVERMPHRAVVSTIGILPGL